MTPQEETVILEAREILGRYLNQNPVLGSWQAVRDYCALTVRGEVERFHVLYLDRRNRVISDEQLSVGTVDHVPVYPREIIKRALMLNASALKSGMLGTTGALRVFLAYLHREGIIANDLTRSLPRGRAYRQASIPRAISWPDVERLLASVDCRSDVGKRDYAILTLLASYGLRAREIAALCLDDIDWVHDQISIPMRKGGHSTRYPLSATVGEAIIAYLHVRRTDIADRQVFLAARSPYTPMRHTGVSCMVSGRMRSIGIQVARAGSHTLRHACVQHLVEADLPFKVIGDYVGHRHPASTLVYGKVAVHKLREMVIAQGEDVL